MYEPVLWEPAFFYLTQELSCPLFVCLMGSDQSPEVLESCMALEKDQKLNEFVTPFAKKQSTIVQAQLLKLLQ